MGDQEFEANPCLLLTYLMTINCSVFWGLKWSEIRERIGTSKAYQGKKSDPLLLLPKRCNIPRCGRMPSVLRGGGWCECGKRL